MWDLVGNPEDRFSHNEAHLLPDKVPTPMTKASVVASRVIAGPSMASPLAMFLVISSLVVELRAKTARALALDRSIRKKKNGKASLEKSEGVYS